MTKIARRHQARQKQQTKHREHTKATSIFSGHNGAPRIVAIVPLTAKGDTKDAVQKLNAGIDQNIEAPSDGHHTVRIDRFKQSIEYIHVKRDLFCTLDACKVADFVIFILSPDEAVDEHGELLLRAVESQGISNVLAVFQGLDTVELPKRRLQVLTSLKSYISHFFPNQEKVHSLDAHQECANVIRSLCTTTPKDIRWREDRSWMLVEDVQWPNDSEARSSGDVVLTGTVRGRPLKANRLVQVGDWGSFQIDHITQAPTMNSKKRKVDEMAVDDVDIPAVLDKPDEDQDDLVDLAPEEVNMDDLDDMPVSEAPTEKRGVLLDDHHYFSDDETHLPAQPKRLPKGTSSYQAAWYLGDMSESGSDLEDDADKDGDLVMEDSPALPQDGIEGLDPAVMRDPTEAGPSEYPQSEMFLDPSPNDEVDELEAYRSRHKDEAAEDREFPDEIELHPNVLARERLAKYRGLKSLRTSKWDTNEDRAYEPENWRRLLQISDYKAARSKATRETLVGGVPPGTRVHIHLRHVPLSLQATFSPTTPLPLFSLLRHEQKRTVANFAITLSSSYPTPLKSKEELIMQSGPRRFIIHPLFSQPANTPNNVHKFLRYLHPGQTAIATFIAPLTWGSVPTLFFKRATTPSQAPATPPLLSLIATGTSTPPDPSRVIAKRIILTGHPFKIHKKLVTVRYMFFNREDVSWFKALQLWTKRGRSGFVKESLGTHGYFKATFDGKIDPQDAVGVSLYKRVWPREARVCGVGELDGLGREEGEVGGDEMVVENVGR